VIGNIGKVYEGRTLPSVELLINTRLHLGGIHVGKGQKKKSISKVDKRSESGKTKWGAKTQDFEKTKRSIHVDDELMANIKAELPKMKYISLTLLAEKYGVRCSTAKVMLEELRRAQLIEEVAHTPRITVFKPVAAS